MQTLVVQGQFGVEESIPHNQNGLRGVSWRLRSIPGPILAEKVRKNDHFVDENVASEKLTWGPKHGSKAGKLQIRPQSISDYDGLWLFDMKMCLGRFFAKMQKRDFLAQFPLAFLQRIAGKYSFWTLFKKVFQARLVGPNN